MPDEPELASILNRLDAEESAKRPPKRPSDNALTIDLEKGEATFDALPDETPGTALARLVKELWHDVDAPTLEILRVKEVTFWGNPEAPFKRFKAAVEVPDVAVAESQRALAECVERMKRRGPLKRAPYTPERTLVVAMADLQIGKAHERFGGTPETVARVTAWRGMLEDIRRDASRAKRPIHDAVMIGMGDTTEGCGSNPNYQTQDFTVDLNQADQVEVATELHSNLLDDLARDYQRVRTTTVSSNHDVQGGTKGNRTGRADHRASTVWRTLAHGVRAHGERYGHVEVSLPEDPNVALYDVHGLGLAAIHGDLPKKGTSPTQKMLGWWKGRQFGDFPEGDAAILVTGHYHHYWREVVGGLWLPERQRYVSRTMFGCPSADGGSGWLADMEGTWSLPGLLVLVVDEWGVDEVHVLPDPELEGRL